MMAGEAFAVRAADTASPLSGTLLLEDGSSLVQAINGKDWVAAAVSGAVVALDVAAAVVNPLATVIAMGVGWVLDHIEPLKSWLNDLTGDAGQVQGFAGTWCNIESHLAQVAGDLSDRVNSDLSAMSGAAINAYRALQDDAAKLLGAAGSWAGAMGTGLEVAATIVQVVHDVVRDAISEIVGLAVQSAAEVIFSCGLATGPVVAQIATKVASMAATIGTKVDGVVKSLRNLGDLLERLKSLFREFGETVDRALQGGMRPAFAGGSVSHGSAPGGSSAVPPPPPPGRGSVPHVPSPDGPPPRVTGGDAPPPRDEADVGAPDSGREHGTVPEGVPLTPEQQQEIVDTPKGSRPDPESYLPPEYVQHHREQFDDGATRFMTQQNHDKYGIGQRDGTAFVMPKKQVEDLLRSTGGDPAKMAEALGLPDDFFATNEVVRIDIVDPQGAGLRMPTGNESGANEQWVPGGKLPGGFWEGVVDAGKLSPSDYSVNPGIPRKK